MDCITKAIMEALSKASYNTKGQVKFKVPGEKTDYECEQIILQARNHFYSDDKIITKVDHIYNDESFTMFILDYQKTTIERLYKALIGMEEIAVDLNNMYGTIDNDKSINKLMESIKL